VFSFQLQPAALAQFWRATSCKSSAWRGTIVYTKTDEAPALATYALLPVIKAFTGVAGVQALRRATFHWRAAHWRRLATSCPQRSAQPDALKELGELCHSPDANVIKLPNISASVPQLKATIAELQRRGFALPPLADAPQSDAERDVAARYAGVLGSAVNPVLRQGNSDRRAPRAVKEYTRKYPPQNKPWRKDAATHVAAMSKGDFYGNERASVAANERQLRIEFVDRASGAVSPLGKKPVKVPAGAVFDSTFLSVAELDRFLAAQIDDAKARNLLFSVHLKATMMKVSDPVIFGHVVRAFFEPCSPSTPPRSRAPASTPRTASPACSSASRRSPTSRSAPQIEADIKATLAARPALAMVDSAKGITNLHVPSDVIIDASMPVVIRDSGCMWGPDNKLHEVKCVIPDRSYAGIYQAVIDDCRQNGAYDATKIGSVANVGLMAEKAEEYGSHDKTFVLPAAGTVRVVDAASGALVSSAECERGDIWRGCVTNDAPIRDWVKLAVQRARLSATPAIFWLDDARAHDAQLIAKVRAYLKEHDLAGLTVQIMSPIAATQYTLARLRRGEDTISVTGNVLRDYLTDLFPISRSAPARACSRSCRCSTAAACSRRARAARRPSTCSSSSPRTTCAGTRSASTWRSPHRSSTSPIATTTRRRALARALDDATAKYLLNGKTPSAKTGEIDNRGSTFYIALYWAEALAKQTDDAALAKQFAPVARQLVENEAKINAELMKVQGSPVDIGGYYLPDEPKRRPQCDPVRRSTKSSTRLANSERSQV
jgi:isocitrate dehydrogenase